MILHKVLKHLETMALDLDGAGRNADENRETEKFHHFSSAQNQLIYSQAQRTFPPTRRVHTPLGANLNLHLEDILLSVSIPFLPSW